MRTPTITSSRLAPSTSAVCQMAWPLASGARLNRSPHSFDKTDRSSGSDPSGVTTDSRTGCIRFHDCSTGPRKATPAPSSRLRAHRKREHGFVCCFPSFETTGGVHSDLRSDRSTSPLRPVRLVSALYIINPVLRPKRTHLWKFFSALTFSILRELPSARGHRCGSHLLSNCDRRAKTRHPKWDFLPDPNWPGLRFRLL